jgi:hypothetical protein
MNRVHCRAHVAEALASARTPESFHVRAAQRVGDTVVAVINGSVKLWRTVAALRACEQRADVGPVDVG